MVPKGLSAAIFLLSMEGFVMYFLTYFLYTACDSMADAKIGLAAAVAAATVSRRAAASAATAVASTQLAHRASTRRAGAAHGVTRARRTATRRPKTAMWGP